MTPISPKQPPRNTSLELLGRVWAVGFGFGMSVIAGGLIGFGVDYFAKTRPTGLLIGLGLGLVTGMIRFVRDARALERESIEESRLDHEQRTTSSTRTK